MYSISIYVLLNFAANSSGERQSKAFERSVNKIPNSKPWSKLCLHFSSSFNKLCCALKPLLNPHCCLESIPSKYADSYL